MNRENTLKTIVREQPGNSVAVQRQRILTAFERCGSLTTFEMMRHLDVYDPRPRIFELRHSFGKEIKTVMRAEETESGVIHRVGVYIMGGPAQ